MDQTSFPTVQQLLTIARGELGVKESPAGSNAVKYNTWYYGRAVSGPAYPWCVVFIQWVFHRAGASLPARTASCTALMNAAKAAGLWVTQGYRPGDVVIYDWGENTVPDHCGIVATVNGGKITAMEGNTAVGNDSDGGEVMVRSRPLTLILGAVRPVYEEEENVVRYQYLTDVPEVYRPIIATLMDLDVIQGNGSDPVGNGDVIDLSHDQVRTLVFLYRGGGFDSKLRAGGMKPVVE